MENIYLKLQLTGEKLKISNIFLFQLCPRDKRPNCITVVKSPNRPVQFLQLHGVLKPWDSNKSQAKTALSEALSL